MAVGNIATKNAGRTAHAFEPGANVVRDIFKLSVIDCARSSRDEDQCSEYVQQRAQPHHESPHTDYRRIHCCLVEGHYSALPTDHSDILSRDREYEISY